MDVQPFYNPKFRAFAANGDPLAGGLLYTYAAGTTTPQSTYTTRAGTVSNANPIVLDANGEADVWTTPGVDYKFVLKTSAGVTQWTVDNVPTPTTLATIQDGTVNAPSLAFANDPDTGLYRIGANNLGVSVGSIKVIDATSTGVTLPVAVTTSAGVSTGSAGDTSPALDHTRTITSVRQLWARIAGAVSGAKARFTKTSTALEMAQNLYFDGTDWRADTAANGAIFAVDGAQTRLFSATGHTAGGLATLTGPLSLDATNPATTTGYANTLSMANIIKAWAVITTNGASGVTLVDGFNVASVALINVSGTIDVRVTMASAMASTNYAVFILPEDFSVGSARVDVASAKTTTLFYVTFTNAAGTLIDASTTASRFAVMVLGRQ